MAVQGLFLERHQCPWVTGADHQNPPFEPWFCTGVLPPRSLRHEEVIEMGLVEKRGGRSRARRRDPAGVQRCATFTRKVDAGRLLREMQMDIERGRWIDPGGAEAAVSVWTEEFLAPVAPPVRAPRRPTGAPSPSSSSPDSAPTGWDICRPARSRTGSTTRGRPGSPTSSLHRNDRTQGRLLQVAVEKQRIPADSWYTATSPSRQGRNVGDRRYPFIETARRKSPRIGPECNRSGAPVTVHSGERLASSEYAISPSKRARGAPRQKWIPWPNASCRSTERSMSKMSGSENSRSSRFADP